MQQFPTLLKTQPAHSLPRMQNFGHSDVHKVAFLLSVTQDKTNSGQETQRDIIRLL